MEENYYFNSISDGVTSQVSHFLFITDEKFDFDLGDFFRDELINVFFCAVRGEIREM